MITHHGHSIAIRRWHMNGEPGWWFDVAAPDGRIVASGWTVGYGPRSRTQAMRDAREAVDARLALHAAVAAKESA